MGTFTSEYRLVSDKTQDFSAWIRYEVGGGVVQPGEDGLRLRLPGVDGRRYADAQVTDYVPGPARQKFRWRPPLRLMVRARASGPAESLHGTAGFGFWNDPFSPARRELPRLPQALWFFCASPPNDMPLALGQPGHGWKAATFDAAKALFWLLLPLAPPGFLLMRVPALYRALWPVGQRALGVAEAALPGDLLAESHEYSITWLPGSATFAVDGQTVLHTDRVPPGPLGLIAWIDNRWAVVTPQGRFGFGTLAAGEQWLDIERVAVKTA